MAELVNQRIENMINELEQMRRTELYNDEEIKEISRKRKEFEYKIQRKVKQKEDYVQYIAYELALLEDISLRRKLNKLGEKKKDIEYTIAKRLNVLFKQFIYRFQNDIAVYFEYIKFCRGVGFDSAISGIIGQMLQMHGDKPKMWQLAAKWEKIEQNNLDTARTFLLKGIHRHPDSDILYLDLFEIELMLALAKDDNEEEKEKQIKRAEVVWKNAAKNLDVSFLLKICDLSMKYDVDSITSEIKKEIWSKRDKKEVWFYVASKELQGNHWEEIEEFIDEEGHFPKEVKNFIAVFEEALQQFPDKELCKKFIHELLGVSHEICSDIQRINVVKHAWMYGHKNGLLTDDMYEFGFEMLKLENETPEEEFMEILETATKFNPQCKTIWEERILHNRRDEKKTLAILQEANKFLKPDDASYLWSNVLDNIESKDMFENFYKKFQHCENPILLSIKPKLLQKTQDLNGLKAARTLYEDLIKTPPTQLELHRVMINIERAQEKPNLKMIRKCFECAVQHHGKDNVSIWMDYMKFETENGSAQNAPAIYRRAVGSLQKELVDEFIKEQTLMKLK